jgi:transketolase N-terminal domain/subunit
MEQAAWAELENLAKLARYYILLSTTAAGSGHPTSSLSATDICTALMFGGFFRYDPTDPTAANNDRLIFSKGHASPLLYALWAAAGQSPKTNCSSTGSLVASRRDALRPIFVTWTRRRVPWVKGFLWAWAWR